MMPSNEYVGFPPCVHAIVETAPTELLEASPDAMKRRREVSSLEREWRFAFPTAVLFDTQYDRLIVCDTQRNRLQIYNKLKDYQPAARTI